jgi:hypothetical protein
VLENTGALPRARAVPRVVARGSDAEVVSELAGATFVPESLTLTTDAPAAGEYATDGVRLDWREDSPDRVALAVTAPARAFVLLADAALAGWSATLDGAPLVIHRVDHVFRGVVVPAGAHEVRFTYSPPGWRAGVALAWGAWVVFGLLVAAAFATRRSAEPAREA